MSFVHLHVHTEFSLLDGACRIRDLPARIKGMGQTAVAITDHGVAQAFPDAMNAAWGGISDDQELSFCVSPSHRTVKDLLARGAFTVSMGTAEQVVACDYVGLVSGNQVPDKFARAGFHATKSEFVDAPCIDELPIAVSCRVVSYDPESCRLVGEIVNVSVDEAYLTPEGKVDVDKVAPITYDSFNKTYVRLGAVVGRAFHDGAALK